VRPQFRGPRLRIEKKSWIPDVSPDLLDRPLVAALTPLMPNGYPQTNPVWLSFEEPSVLVNTMREFRKERNMRAGPPGHDAGCGSGPGVHWIEVRGLVSSPRPARSATSTPWPTDTFEPGATSERWSRPSSRTRRCLSSAASGRFECSQTPRPTLGPIGFPAPGSLGCA
jgi:hypothetical protein